MIVRPVGQSITLLAKCSGWTHRRIKQRKQVAGVGTVQRSVETIVGQARCGETWMRRNDYNDSQQQQSNDHVQSATPELEPRAHEKNCVWQVKDARSAVCCSRLPSLTKESTLLVSETFEKPLWFFLQREIK